MCCTDLGETWHGGLLTHLVTHLVTDRQTDKPVGFYGPIAPPVPNAPSSLHAAAPPVQSEYHVKRRAAAAVPLPESQ